MAAPIDLRNDFDSVSLRRLAKRTRDATQSRRLLALAEVYDGGSRTDASRIGGVGLQIIRDWVLRFNARGPDGLVDGKSPGAPSKLNADHRRALAEVVEAGPVPAVDGVVRWRRKDLARWLLETFAISLDETTVGRELKALGFAKISARPRHYAQNELAVEAFKKNFPAELAKIRARLPKGVEIELWWQDEARIGQKNKLTRRWARRGTRPRAPRDQRTEWAGARVLDNVLDRGEHLSAAMGWYRFRHISPDLHQSLRISSARSVPRRGKAPGWSCPGATPTPWRRTSSRSVPPSIPAPMRC